MPVALQTVLKALNNRKYIYVLNTKFTHEQYEIRLQRQVMERVQQEEKARLGKFNRLYTLRLIFVLILDLKSMKQKSKKCLRKNTIIWMKKKERKLI